MNRRLYNPVKGSRMDWVRRVSRSSKLARESATRPPAATANRCCDSCKLSKASAPLLLSLRLYWICRTPKVSPQCQQGYAEVARWDWARQVRTDDHSAWMLVPEWLSSAERPTSFGCE